jgi:hypothetical protein
MRALVFLVAMAAAPIVITKAADVPPNVGKVVTLDGVVENSKIPTLLDVDVAETALRGQRAVATGRLERYTIAPPDPKEPIAATRGPGTYYRLVDPQTGRLAQPRKP